jgi:ankyrin repeat protein
VNRMFAFRVVRPALCFLVIVLFTLPTNICCQYRKPPIEVLNRDLLDASYGGSVEEVKRLIDMGADINTKNQFGLTPFELAIVGNNCGVVEYYLQLGQNPNVERGGGTPLMSAAANGNVELLQLLLKYGADPELPGDGKATALMSATQHTEIFKILVNRGANIHARDNYGRTVLIWAALHGTEEVVALLCEMGADPGIKDKGGNTALTEAKNKGRSRIASLLENCSKK